MPNTHGEEGVSVVSGGGELGTEGTEWTFVLSSPASPPLPPPPACFLQLHG